MRIVNALGALHGGRSSAAIAIARRPVNLALRSRLVSAMCAPRSVDAYLQLFDPTWSVREVRARITAVMPEAGGATSLWLRPNEHWRGFRAGQYVRVTAEIGGVRYARCFSLSSAPADGLPLRITIRSLRSGRVAGWAERAARRGQVVALSQALGEFVVPSPAPARLLLVGGGSGITPLASILRELLATGYRGELVCLHYARHEPILGAELAALAARDSRLRYVAVRSSVTPEPGGALRGHFSHEHLDAVAPHWTEFETFVCGPAPLQAAVAEVLRARGLGDRLHVERFVAALPPLARGAGPRCRITFARSGRELEADAAATLLEHAEGAGLRPAHGCRMGICHTCKCRKLSGVVRNELTGGLSSEPDEEIQLCVSTARSDITLDL